MTTKLIVAALFVGTITWYGCGSDESPAPADCAANPVELSVVSVMGSTCNAADGSFEVLASGGSGSYSYRLAGGNEQTSAVFNNMAAGVYTVTAMDANECQATLDVSVTNENGLNVTFETSSAGCKETNGAITVHAVDGTAPYQFKIDNGSFSETNAFNGLPAGTHTVVTSDATGCSVSQVVTVPSGVSFASNISPIISGVCAVSTCHGGTQAPDFRVFKNIHDNAAQIKTLTGNRTMPQEGSLTQTQIDMIACWVDDGALQN